MLVAILLGISPVLADALMPTPVPTQPVNLSSHRKVHPATQPGELIELSLKELGNIDYDPAMGGGIPDDVKAMSGVKVRLTGYMVLMDQAENITHFAIVPSLFCNCGFCSAPQMQQTSDVTVPKGKVVQYFPDPVTVEGTLHVREQKEDGFIVSIFDVEATSVKPAAK